jgi:hypothetical protein
MIFPLGGYFSFVITNATMQKNRHLPTKIMLEGGVWQKSLSIPLMWNKRGTIWIIKVKTSENNAILTFRSASSNTGLSSNISNISNIFCDPPPPQLQYNPGYAQVMMKC